MGFISLSLGLSLGSLVSREYLMSLVVRMGRHLLFRCSISFSLFFSFIFWCVIQEVLSGIEIDQKQMSIMF